jgi:hypothetical protein
MIVFNVLSGTLNNIKKHFNFFLGRALGENVTHFWFCHSFLGFSIKRPAGCIEKMRNFSFFHSYMTIQFSRIFSLIANPSAHEKAIRMMGSIPVILQLEFGYVSVV